MSAMSITKWKNDRSNARLTRGVFSKAEPELLIVRIEFHPSQLSMAEENGDMTLKLLLTSKIRPMSSMQSSAKIPRSIYPSADQHTNRWHC